MATQFVTSVSEIADSKAAAEDVVKKALAKLKGKKPNLAVLFGSVNYRLDEVIQVIRKHLGDVPLTGCSASGEFTEESVVKKGLALALIASDNHQFFTGSANQIRENGLKSIQAATSKFPSDVEGFPYQSAMLLIDGLAGKGEETVLAASSILGSNVKFAGGAAGDDLSFKETFVFNDKSAQTNSVSACLIASKKPVSIGVKHGHKPVSPAFKVTKVKDNVIYEIEGKPAIEAWRNFLKERVKEEEGIDITKVTDRTELSKILLRYEAGLLTGNDYKIRFPASVNPDGSLNFVCSIVEGSTIRIMDSQVDDQLKSTQEAVQEAIHHAKGAKIAGAVVFDCACRGAILKDRYKDAVQEIKTSLGNVPFIGAETYGEIAMEMGQLSGFHNATTVVMLITA
jgi:methyl-accepting chemotaxis protein